MNSGLLGNTRIYYKDENQTEGSYACVFGEEMSSVTCCFLGEKQKNDRAARPIRVGSSETPLEEAAVCLRGERPEEGDVGKALPVVRGDYDLMLIVIALTSFTPVSLSRRASAPRGRGGCCSAPAPLSVAVQVPREKGKRKRRKTRKL